MEEKIKRIKKWKEGNQAGPYTLEINPTNRCNLECRFCWQRGTNPDLSKELSSDKLIKTIEEAANLGVEEVRIPGSGEPLIRKEVVVEMIKIIKENNMHGLLITNGTFLDEDLMKRLVEWDWDNLTVSIDGPDADTHDYLRQKEGTFRQVEKNLKKLNRIKSETASEKPKLRFNCVLTDKNYDKLPEMLEFAKNYGCQDFQLQPMTPFSHIGEQCMFNGDEEELDKYLRKASEIAEKYNIYNNLDDFVSNDVVKRTDEMDEVTKEEVSAEGDDFLSAPCYEPWYNMVILPNGKTAQCSMFGGKGGVQIKGKSLEEVWFGEYFERTRERILKGDMFEYCENCCVPVNMENRKIRNELKDNSR